jgi:hypothetical protein
VLTCRRRVKDFIAAAAFIFSTLQILVNNRALRSAERKQKRARFIVRLNWQSVLRITG